MKLKLELKNLILFFFHKQSWWGALLQTNFTIMTPHPQFWSLWLWALHAPTFRLYIDLISLLHHATEQVNGSLLNIDWSNCKNAQGPCCILHCSNFSCSATPLHFCEALTHGFPSLYWFCAPLTIHFDVSSPSQWLISTWISIDHKFTQLRTVKQGENQCNLTRISNYNDI